jgi:molybdopterin/thiamine biosynthesis adenylyltransferase
MPSLVQVGVGSGGMVVLDLLSRDERLTAVTLIEPDVYRPHNVVRHYFPPTACGRPKAELAAAWLRDRRPDLRVHYLIEDLLNPAAQAALEAAVAPADVGVCAVDNEPAKYQWDELMRFRQKPWTLGEVLSGGIGGFIHRFRPGGPCYGCVASRLKREVSVDKPPSPDYSAPGGPVYETTIPASAAAIHAIASLHALATLDLLSESAKDEDWTSLLWTLRKVPDVFAEAYQPYRFAIPRLHTCLVCQPPPAPLTTEDLDPALDQALTRLGHP